MKIKFFLVYLSLILIIIMSSVVYAKNPVTGNATWSWDNQSDATVNANWGLFAAGGMIRNFIDGDYINHTANYIRIHFKGSSGQDNQFTKAFFIAKSAGSGNLVAGTLQNLTCGGTELPLVPQSGVLDCDLNGYTLTKGQDYIIGWAIGVSQVWSYGNSAVGSWYKDTADQTTWQKLDISGDSWTQHARTVSLNYIEGLYIAPPTPPINLTIQYPSLNQILYRDFYINGTTTNKANCSINNPIWSLDSTNSTKHSFLNTSTVPEGAYSIFINCTLGQNATINFTAKYNRTLKFIANNSITKQSIELFNVTYNNKNYTSELGITLINISYSTASISPKVAAINYFTNTTGSLTASQENFTILLRPEYYYYNGVWGNYHELGNFNYTRNLNFSASLYCKTGSNVRVHIYLNGTSYYNVNATCTGTTETVKGNYTHSMEGTYNATLFLDVGNAPSFNGHYNNNTFKVDLYPPRIKQLNFSIQPTGFYEALTNITLKCDDNITYDLIYNLSLNKVSYYYSNATNNTLIQNQTKHINGLNALYGSCYDHFDLTEGTYTDTVYYAFIILIDEKDNTVFNLNNVTTARVYYDDNSTLFDFKQTMNTSVNFTSINSDKLRFEFTYAAGEVITRYVDLSLAPSPLRVCINKQGITHYEQLIISASPKEAVLKNVFSDCVVAADYTRFAYQNGFLLKAFTIDSMYYLYTYINNNQTFLASLDGSIQTYINLDTIEDSLEGYDFNIIGESIATEKTTGGNILIYYKNSRNTNLAATATIYRQDTNALVFTTSTITDPNEFSILFDYSTISNITNTTLFKITVEKTQDTGITKLSRYFNISASSGALSSQFAFVIALFMVIFGLTFTLTRLSLSWFGLIIMLGTIIFLSFSIMTWYILFMMAVCLVMTVYIVIVMVQQHNPAIT